MRKETAIALALSLSGFLSLQAWALDEEPSYTPPDQAALTTALAPPKKDPETFYKAGCALLQQKKYQGALDQFNKALELNPHYYEASYKKALVYQLTGYDKFAALRYQDILSHKPDMDEARINLAALHHKHKHYSGAEEQYRTVISHNYYSFEAHYDLANTLVDQNKLEDAMKEYKICLKLRPNNALVHNNMGAIFLQKNYVEDAMHEFKRAAAASPGNPAFSGNVSIAQKMLAKKKKQSPSKAITM